MIFCRYLSGQEQKFGIVQNHVIQEISSNPFDGFEETGESVPLPEARLLAPVLPSKIVAVGINYREHAREMNHSAPKEPVIFIKPATGVIGSLGTILYPKMAHQVDYEAELAVVIKKKAKNVSVEESKDYILGYTCFNDVTARDLQKKDGQWSRAKGFDSFSPIGPWIVTDLDPHDLAIESYLNGEVKQTGRTSEMIFGVPYLVSFISEIMTLEPGDVVTTGTPQGVGPMQPGDTIDVRIEGIGVLRNIIQKDSNHD